jgi:hypothetical protein
VLRPEVLNLEVCDPPLCHPFLPRSPDISAYMSCSAEPTSSRRSSGPLRPLSSSLASDAAHWTAMLTG